MVFMTSMYFVIMHFCHLLVNTGSGSGIMNWCWERESGEGVREQHPTTFNNTNSGSEWPQLHGCCCQRRSSVVVNSNVQQTAPPPRDRTLCKVSVDNWCRISDIIMFHVLVWSTRKSSAAPSSVVRDSLLRPPATPSPSVNCNNRRLRDNSKPSVMSADPGNPSRQGRERVFIWDAVLILVAIFRSSPSLTNPEVSSQWKRVTTNKSSSQQQKNHLYLDHRSVNKAKST